MWYAIEWPPHVILWRTRFSIWNNLVLLTIFESLFCDLIRYLNVPNIMAAAIGHRCTMLHPGYGFLAENATFVDICKDHGLNFIGPNVSSAFSAFKLCILWLVGNLLQNRWWVSSFIKLLCTLQSDSIRVMGDKATARETMKNAGVPTVPGSEGLVQVRWLSDQQSCLLFYNIWKRRLLCVALH